MIKIPKIGPNLTQLFAKLTKTYGFTQEKKRELTKLGVFEQKFVKCTTVRTKITKIRPNLTQLFATLTKTQGFTKKEKWLLEK